MQLAGVRNVQPRPSVGHKFHAVLVVNSAHIASISSPDEHRWLPIFWALDNFKEGQAADTREGNWTMAPVDESAVPPAHKARQAFIDAMDRWDEAAADAAVAGLARTASVNEVFELFYRYGCRDFRSIGHKAIYVANACRTLECIGWQHAEPVLRSLAYALLMHDGKENPAKSDQTADRYGRRNAELAKKLREDWRQGKLEDSATLEMVDALRSASEEDCCRQAVADDQSRRVAAVDLGRVFLISVRAGDAAAGHRAAARRHVHQRAAVRLSERRPTIRRAACCCCRTWRSWRPSAKRPRDAAS